MTSMMGRNSMDVRIVKPSAIKAATAPLITLSSKDSLTENSSPYDGTHRGRWHGLRRGSMWTAASANMSEKQEPEAKKQNSYRLEPAEDDKFKITNSLQQDYEAILEKYLSGVVYSQANVPSLVKTISDALKQRSKMACGKRYKCLVYVTVIEKKGQAVHQASRCVWNPATDNSCFVQYENGELLASAAVFAVYAD